MFNIEIMSEQKCTILYRFVRFLNWPILFVRLPSINSVMRGGPRIVTHNRFYDTNETKFDWHHQWFKVFVTNRLSIHDGRIQCCSLEIHCSIWNLRLLVFFVPENVLIILKQTKCFPHFWVNDERKLIETFPVWRIFSITEGRYHTILLTFCTCFQLIISQCFIFNIMVINCQKQTFVPFQLISVGFRKNSVGFRMNTLFILA